MSRSEAGRMEESVDSGRMEESEESERMEGSADSSQIQQDVAETEESSEVQEDVAEFGESSSAQDVAESEGSSPVQQVVPEPPWPTSKEGYRLEEIIGNGATSTTYRVTLYDIILLYFISFFFNI